ncbi:MAG: hypothetical protein ABL984_05725 [Pyrinomonadaceae bacterium]
MAIKINGVDGTFRVPTLLNKKYKYVKFDPQMTATMLDGGTKIIDIKPKLNTVWAEVERKAKLKPCNDYFKTLSRINSLSLEDVLKAGDITLHLLEPKPGSTYADVPYANTAGRDIGIDPNLLFDVQANLACTLIHELAHVAGATTNASAPFVEAHAAEAALPLCGCAKQYDKTIIGRIQSISSARFGYA